jgi:hypothetical protein
MHPLSIRKRLRGAEKWTSVSPCAMGVGVAFFDLDHTIIDTNSSWHWVQHEINTGRVGASMLFTAMYWFGRYALGGAPVHI